jgi:isopentenyl phosphate kinase
MKLVKLGGSIITDKRVMRRFSRKTAARLASEVARAHEQGEEMILVNGAGSFGHMLAREFELQKGYSCPEQIPAVAKVMKDVRDLNVRLLAVLNEAGVPAVSIPPNVVIVNRNRRIERFDASAFRRHLELGLVPVSFGDVVPDSTLGFSICSGDQIMLKLAQEMDVDRAYFVTDVDGVFSANPSRNKFAHLIPVVDKTTLGEIESTEASAPDVTGGIREKLWLGMEIARHNVEVVILNGSVRGRLRDALLGKEVICSVIKRDGGPDARGPAAARPEKG